MSKIAQIVVIFSYLAGVAFGLAAIIKFKQHKDNPTQIHIGLYLLVSFIGLLALLYAFSRDQAKERTDYLP